MLCDPRKYINQTEIESDLVGENIRIAIVLPQNAHKIENL